ncbi:MAG: DUF456 domain-containing protein [Bacteroidales bacterium]
MDWIFIIVGILLCILGIIGAIIPALPGPILSFLSILSLQGTTDFKSSNQTVILLGTFALLVTIMDYIIPGLGTKKLGGTKAGIKGSNIGLLVSVFIFPMFGLVLGPFGLIGIIIGPFAGAYIGEKVIGNNSDQAFRSAIGSFLGFISGTFIKLIFSIVVIFFFCKAFF